jgi:hypothetical protein
MAIRAGGALECRRTSQSKGSLMSADPAILTGLDELVSAIRAFADPRRAGDQWKQAFKLLQKAGLPPGRINAVVGMRDPDALAELVDSLRAPAEEAAPGDGAPDQATCRRALQAFRKRLALTVLDEESTLGRGPLSKGANASAAIVPPREWPDEVWQELVRQGKLKCVGHGLYERVKQ